MAYWLVCWSIDSLQAGSHALLVWHKERESCESMQSEPEKLRACPYMCMFLFSQ